MTITVEQENNILKGFGWYCDLKFLKEKSNETQFKTSLTSPRRPSLSISSQTWASASAWRSGCRVWELPVQTDGAHHKLIICQLRTSGWWVDSADTVQPVIFDETFTKTKLTLYFSCYLAVAVWRWHNWSAFGCLACFVSRLRRSLNYLNLLEEMPFGSCFFFCTVISLSTVWESESSSHRPGSEVFRLKAPLLAVGFIVQQVLLHDLVFRLEQEVAVRTGHGPATLVRWSEERSDARMMGGKEQIQTGWCYIKIRIGWQYKRTFIIGVLEIVVNSGHEFLHEMSPNVGHQVFLTLQLTL